jgi:biopolymer transport protein ExbB
MRRGLRALPGRLAAAHYCPRPADAGPLPAAWRAICKPSGRADFAERARRGRRIGGRLPQTPMTRKRSSAPKGLGALAAAFHGRPAMMAMREATLPKAMVRARGLLRVSVVAAAVTACCLLPSAAAQGPRNWAGSDLPAREPTRQPVRMAQAPGGTATVADDTRPAAAAETLIPTGNLLATIRDGGILMVPLLGCSFLLAVFGIERAVSLRTGRVVPRLFVTRFVEQVQSRQIARGEALDACEENGSPAAKVFAAAVRRWGRPQVEIEQAAIDACEREINHLRRYRRIFNGVATIGPLLGLLGTVFGLIRSFNDVAGAGAMGRPDLLARGFGEALITTAMGLLVAIPAMVLHWIFTSRVDRLAMRLDEACQQVIDEISQEALGDVKRRAAG